LGAGISTLLTEAIMGLILFRATAVKNGIYLQILKLGFKPFFASLAAAGVVLLLRPMHIVLLSLAAALTYFGTLTIIRFWTGDEIATLKTKIMLFFARQRSV
jgi:hypothetical protein